MNHYLCFDAGTQSVKVAVYSAEGECVAKAVNPTTLFYPHPGWVEMDVEEYFQLTLAGMKDCAEQMGRKGLDPASVRAVMGDGIICGVAGVDEAGHAITPYINYLDSRTQEDAAALTALGTDLWARETGNPDPLCLFPALHARWLLKNAPARGRVRKLMHNAPYILLNLAGLGAQDAFIDWGTLSGWGLGYDVTKKRWSPEQLEILGIAPSLLPRIVRPWDVVGGLSEEAAARTGFPPGLPVCAGAGDTMQSLLGCGVFAPGHAVDVAGTCSMFCISTAGIVPDLSRSGNNLIFNSATLPDTYFYWGFVRTGGLALRWFRDNVCGQPGDDGCYDRLSQGATRVPAGANGVRFLPWLTGGPKGCEEVHGCFLNMTMDTDQFVLWRAVLEAIAGEYGEIADRCRTAGTPVERIIVTEGGSRSALWNQIKADLIRAETVTLDTGGALATNALLAAYAAGDISGGEEGLKAALRQGLRETGRFAPGPEFALPPLPSGIFRP